MREKHRNIFRQFSSTFREETVQKWAKSVEDWNEDHSKPNPYAEPKSGMSYRSPHKSHTNQALKLATTLQDVRLQLAREEAADAAQGNLPLHRTTLTSFLTLALDLEEQQYVYILSI